MFPKIVLCCFLMPCFYVWCSDVQISRKTMRQLCQMEQIQELNDSDMQDFEPAAVVYEVMSRRLEHLETQVVELERRLEEGPTKTDIEAVATALRLELMEHINSRITTLSTELQANLVTVVSNVMENLVAMGMEYRVVETSPAPTTPPEPQDCNAFLGQSSGVYSLKIDNSTIDVYCDLELQDPWMVIQRRVDGEVLFNRSWIEYKEGFGTLASNFYLGNEKIHMISSRRPVLLRIELMDQTGNTAYAEYSNFSVSDEGDGYRLQYSQYSGTAGDALKTSKGRQFSTHDVDRDTSPLYSCAKLHKGGFWYDKCGKANLNGVYQSRGYNTFNWQNILWYSWKQDLRSMARVEMKLRPH